MSYDVFWHMEYLCEALIYSIHFSYIFFIWKVRPFERRLFTIQTFVSPRCLVSNDWWIKKSSNVRIAHCLSSQSPYTNSSVWWWISDMFILFVLLYWRHYQTFLVYLIFNISFQTLSHSHDVARVRKIRLLQPYEVPCQLRFSILMLFSVHRCLTFSHSWSLSQILVTFQAAVTVR